MLERNVRGDIMVQLVGVQNVGFMINTFTIHILGRHVAVLQREVRRYEPMQLSEFGKVIEVMRAAVRLKGITEVGIEAVQEWERGVRSEEDVLWERVKVCPKGCSSGTSKP